MLRTLLAATLVLALAMPLAAPASPTGVASGWRIVQTIDTATARPAKAFEAFDTASLVLYDFDGDGQLEIVSNNDNNHAYVLDSKTGAVLAEIVTTHPNGDSWPVRELNPISIGDLYGDGVPCMVIPNSASMMSAWCYDRGASTPLAYSFVKKWEIRVDAALYEADFHETHPWIKGDNDTGNDWPGLDGHAYLADSDGDKRMEVFVETDGYPGQFAFNTDGGYRWSRSFADGNAGARVLDLNGAGGKEAVFVSDSGLITCYDAKTGSIRWTFESRKYGATPGSIPVAPLVADLHGDGKFEILFGARNVAADLADPNWVNESHAMYFALDSAGRVLWNVSYDWMNPLQYNHPAAADVDGDGVLDAVFLDWNTVGHKPGAWNTTNRQSNLFVLSGKDGSAIWHRGISVFWSNKDIVIADADGDGKQDIIAPTAKGGEDGLGVYDLKTGEPKGWLGVPWQLSRGPVAAPLYGDGKLYIVAPIARSRSEPNYRDLDVGYREGALLVIETGAAYDVLFSANILNSEDQKEKQVVGTVKVPPPTPIVTPPPPPPPPTPPPPPVTTPPTPTPPANTTTPPPATTASTPPLPTEPPRTTPTESVDVPGHGLALALVGLAAAAALLHRRRR